jgi:hypothetical protein
MKKWILILSLIVISALNKALSQNSTGWYSVKELTPKVWVISDHGADNMYLIEGNDKSLLVDTGLGAADLTLTFNKFIS